MIKKKFFIFLFFGCIGYILGSIIALYSTHVIEDKILFLFPYTHGHKHHIVFEIQNLYSSKESFEEYKGKIISIDNKNPGEKINMLFIFRKNTNIQKYSHIQTYSSISFFENSNAFHYKEYMLSQNIFAKTYIQEYDIVSSPKINIFEKSIIHLRKKIIDVIHTIYPHEEAIFLGGVLIGAKENIPAHLKQDFNNSGLAHLIAVSGFNITIVILFVTKILQFLPKCIKIPLVSICVIGFMILVGDTAPVIRASLSGIIGYYILVSGRNQNYLTVLLGVLGIMSCYNPLGLNYDISLQLSFLAVLGIMFTQDFFSRLFVWIPNVLEIRSAFVMTLCALSFTLPLMIVNFGQFSLIAPIANIAITWTMGIVMLFGFISIIAFFFVPLLGSCIAYITWIFLKWDIMMVHFFGKLDWAILKYDIGMYKNHFMILYFTSLLFIIILFYKKEDKA